MSGNRVASFSFELSFLLGVNMNKEKSKVEKVDSQHAEVQDKDFKHIIRLLNADLNGNKKIITSLKSIRGVSFMFANAVCKVAGVDPNQKTGYLKDKEVSKIEEVLKNPANFNIPSWMFNRRRDLETDKDIHVLGVDLEIKTNEDIRRMKMIRSYRGIRHMFHLPVRGQRTRSNFRRNKGRVVGVLKRAAKAAKGAKDAKGKVMRK